MDEGFQNFRKTIKRHIQSARKLKKVRHKTTPRQSLPNFGKPAMRRKFLKSTREKDTLHI